MTGMVAQDVVTDGDGRLGLTIRHFGGAAAARGARMQRGGRGTGMTDGFDGALTARFWATVRQCDSAEMHGVWGGDG